MSTNQKNFIEIIVKHLPEGVKLVDFISNLVHLGKEASYRRIRCEVEFTLSEIVIIAKELNINLTSLIIREGGEKVTCNLRLIEEDTPQLTYCKMIEADLNVFEGIDTQSKHLLFTINHTLPLFFTTTSALLTKLRLLKIQFNQGSLNPKKLKDLELTKDIKTINEKYLKAISSFDVEVVMSQDIIANTVLDIDFFFRIGLITEEEQGLLLKELEQTIFLLQEITHTGTWNNKNLQLYVSYLSLDSSHQYIYSNGVQASLLDLHVPNSLLSFDKTFNTMHFNRIEIIKKGATLITKSGEIEKASFFKKQFNSIKRDW
ncbi:MAG: hypothetical protein LBE34_02910 [Flavobacteriaceae bacterium]|jgi:hypothetical protein|nr:hypothetical protein [Flavobacteriaceae bacterium]